MFIKAMKQTSIAIDEYATCFKFPYVSGDPFL